MSKMRLNKEEQEEVNSMYTRVCFLLKAANNTLKHGDIDEISIHWTLKEIEDIVTQLAQLKFYAEMRTVNRVLKENFKYAKSRHSGYGKL